MSDTESRDTLDSPNERSACLPWLRSSFLPRRRIVIVLGVVVVVCAVSVVLCLRNRTAKMRAGPETVTRVFESLTADGEVVFRAGDPVKLAGVRMRPVEETGEPTILDVAEHIVADGSSEVEVLVDQESQLAVVYYQQRIKYRDIYGPGVLRRAVSPDFASGSVNELLIVLGVARYDRDRMPTALAEARAACEVAQEKADLARWSRHTYRPPREILQDPSIVYDELVDGYRPRITIRDKVKQDRDLTESDRRDTEIETMRQRGEDCIPALCEDLRSDNRFIRRGAAYALAESDAAPSDAVAALIKALDDEDRYVRAYAANALRRLGANEAIDALRALLARERVWEVRDAAKAALREIEGSDK